MSKVFAIIAMNVIMALAFVCMASADYLWSVAATTPTNGNSGIPTTFGVMIDHADTYGQEWTTSTNAYSAEVIFATDGSKSRLLRKDWTTAADERCNRYFQIWAGSDYAADTLDFKMWLSYNSGSGSSARPITLVMIYDPFGIIPAGTVLSPTGIATAAGGSQTDPVFKYNLKAFKTGNPLAANNGYIIGTLPEPSSIIAMLSGLVSLLGIGILRRR